MKLTWKNEGSREDSLYFGRIYAGSVRCMVPLGWREHYANINTSEATPQYIKDNMQRNVAYYEAHEQRPWRAWIMSNEDGEELGCFATRQQAKEALEKAALRSPTSQISARTPAQ